MAKRMQGDFEIDRNSIKLRRDMEMYYLTQKKKFHEHLI